MAREVDDHVCRYDHVCAPGHLASMVVSTIHDHTVMLKTPDVMTGNEPLCPGSRGIDGTHHKQLRAPMPSKRAKVELRL
jgi:hypothetical protein